ncbi:MAG TPA: Ig-like domain-containing protein, partial [Verrucomicrobiae bacterium]|nr:Ig-like domain-containing protein [Verrucomicrobiae bacterium]
IQLYGPYKGKLSNRQGNIELYRPDAPQVPPHPDAGLTPQILVDRAQYEDRPPWPSNSVDGTVWADGGFGSLQRRFSYEYGNDPTNWFVDRPTPGYYNSSLPFHRELPYFLLSPRDYIDVAPRTNVVLSVQTRGDPPITYQWFRNGAPIVGPGATSANLPVNNVGAANIGQYFVVAGNLAGLSTSRVATISIACPFLLSSSIAAFGQPGGEGSVTVIALEGCPWEVTGIPPWVTVTSAVSFDGTDTFTFTIGAHSGTTVRSATLTIAGQPFKISQSPPDSMRPTVAFTAPASGARVTTATTAIRGTASDNYGVARVELQMGSGNFVPVSYDARAWTNIVSLEPGTNWVRVRSIDLSGNISVTNIRSVVYVVTSPLNLVTNSFGWGTVSGATNLQRLELERGYTLTAAARPGYVFSNWTGGIPTSSAAKLQFLMRPDLHIAANFVPNPFIPVKGTYNGLFSVIFQVYHTNSGSFKLTTTVKGTYSASISVGGRKYSTSGQLDLFGRATNVINRTGLSPLIVEWRVKLGTDENSRGYVNGIVNSTNWETGASLDGVLATTNAAAFAGKYTLTVAGVPDDPTYPGGDGYGTVTIDAKGNVKFSGVLADGVKVTRSVPLSKNAYWPHHAVAYSGRGSTYGWIGIDPNNEFSQLDGRITWLRPSNGPPKFYTNGFILDTHLTGSLYRAPVGATNRILNLTNAQIVLNGGNLASSPSINNVILGLSSKVTNASPNTLTCTFTLSTGLFTGTYREPGATLTITFRGAVLQQEKQNRGSGHFLGTTESGQVVFEARPTPP